MRIGLSDAQEQALTRPTADIIPPSVGQSTPTKEIPYDYVAKFKLAGKGERKKGNRVQDVINISTEGSFVAVAIGYSFIPGKLELVSPPRGLALTAANLSVPIERLSDTDRDTLLQCLFVKNCGITFKYSIVDSGSGRELQNQPIHNVAGLGEANGERPFRPLAKPMIFMPRSTIRIEVEEISEGSIYESAELYIVLHGYKMLGQGI